MKYKYKLKRVHITPVTVVTAAKMMLEDDARCQVIWRHLGYISLSYDSYIMANPRQILE